MEVLSDKVGLIFSEVSCLPLLTQVQICQEIERRLSSLYVTVTQQLKDSIETSTTTDLSLWLEDITFKKFQPLGRDLDAGDDEKEGKKYPWWFNYPTITDDLLPAYKRALLNKRRNKRKKPPMKSSHKSKVPSEDKFSHHKQQSAPTKGKTVCEECGKEFCRPYSLRQHQRTAHQPATMEAIQCEDCGRMFKTTGGLSGHRKRYHNIGREVHRCPQCSYATFTSSSLDIHMERYHGPNHKRNSVCEICGKGFSKRSLLKFHLEIHTKNKKYSCKHCSFTSNTITGLRSHTYTQHNPNARSYQCELCCKKWTKRVYYKGHMLRHHGISVELPRSRKGPQPVCADSSSLREKAAVDMAVKSMANLSKVGEADTIPDTVYSEQPQVTNKLPVFCMDPTSDDTSLPANQNASYTVHMPGNEQTVVTPLLPPISQITTTLVPSSTVYLPHPDGGSLAGGSEVEGNLGAQVYLMEEERQVGGIPLVVEQYSHTLLPSAGNNVVTVLDSLLNQMSSDQ